MDALYTVHHFLQNSVTGSERFLVSYYGLCIITLCFVCYVHYIHRLFRRDMLPPWISFALWTFFNAGLVASEWMRGICNMQMIVYFLGGVVILGCILWSRRPKVPWSGRWDGYAVALSVAAYFAWWLSGEPLVATFFLIAANYVAAVPMVRSLSAPVPADEPFLPWILLFLGSLVSILDGNAFTGVAFAVLQAVILWLMLQNRLRLTASLATART